MDLENSADMGFMGGMPDRRFSVGRHWALDDGFHHGQLHAPNSLEPFSGDVPSLTPPQQRLSHAAPENS